MSARKHRPRCLQCDRRLGRYIRTVSIPHDLDLDAVELEAYISRDAAYRIGGADVRAGDIVIVDTPARIRGKQARERERFAEYQRLYRDSELAVAPGANDPGPGYRQIWHQDIVDRGPPQASGFPVTVRIWIPGEYGPDGLSLFHSGTCAQRWAYTLAGKLRAQGRI